MCLINLNSCLSGETPDGVWTQIVNSGNTVFTISNNTINTDNAALGTYTFQYAVSNAACSDSEQITIIVSEKLNNIVMPICATTSFNIFTLFPTYYNYLHGASKNINSYSLSYASGSAVSGGINLTTGAVNGSLLAANTNYIINASLGNLADNCACDVQITLFQYGCSSITAIASNCQITYTSNCSTVGILNTVEIQQEVTSGVWTTISNTQPANTPQGNFNYRVRIWYTYNMNGNLINCVQTSNTVNFNCVTDVCNICTLNLPNCIDNITLLSCGNLSSGSGCPVGNYVIDWYRNAVNSNNLVFTSGNQGNTDSAINVFHPFTGTSSIPVDGGTYIPIIRYASVNNILYSTNPYPNATHSPTLSDCLVNPIITDASPSNSLAALDGYTHSIEYSNTTATTLTVKRIKFDINSNSRYLAYRLFTYSLSDQLRVLYINGQTGVSTVLENLVTGADVVTENGTSVPKQLRGTTAGGIKGIVELPTYVSGSYLYFEITPNYFSTATTTASWLIRLKELTAFDCTCSAVTSYYPGLFTSSIVDTTCLKTLTTSFDTPCSVYKYIGNANNTNNINSVAVQANLNTTYGHTLSTDGTSGTCTTLSGNVTYTKTGNTFTIAFSNQTDYATYALKFSIIASDAASCNDNTQIGYYNFYYITMIISTSCSGNPGINQWFFRSCNQPVFNAAARTITITSSAMTFGLTTSGSCNVTTSYQNAVNNVNNTLALADFTYTNTVMHPAFVFRNIATATAPTATPTGIVDVEVNYYFNIIPASILSCTFLSNCNIVLSTVTRRLRFARVRVDITNTSNPLQNFRVLVRPLTTFGCANTTTAHTLIYEIQNNIQIFP